MESIKQIQTKFNEVGSPVRIPLQRGRWMTAELVDAGIRVDNLGNQPFLPWAVFEEAIRIIKDNGGKARRGNAMNYRLGESGLLLDSIEGHVAHVVFGIQPKRAVFRRITPIAAILVWAGICKAGRGELILNSSDSSNDLAAQEKKPVIPLVLSSRNRTKLDTCGYLRLANLTIAEFKLRLCGFRKRYMDDWEGWLSTPPSKTVSVFGKILRTWQATRPNPMRRHCEEAEHLPPYLNDLTAEAVPHLDATCHLTVADFANLRSVPVDAMHALWEIFENLPVTGKAKCAGITKAVMLLTNGRIGPAFDRIVRTQLGIKEPKCPTQWLEQLQAVAWDIRAFEDKNQTTLKQATPLFFGHIESGRLYDMAFGPRETTE